jgi:hypothetical protein
MTRRSSLITAVLTLSAAAAAVALMWSRSLERSPVSPPPSFSQASPVDETPSNPEANHRDEDGATHHHAERDALGSEKSRVEDVLSRIGSLSTLLNEQELTASLRTPSLEEFPVQELHHLVTTNGFTPEELRAAYEALEETDIRRAWLLLSTAWARDAKEEDRVWLLRIARGGASQVHFRSAKALSCLAAVHALRLSGGGTQLADLVSGILSAREQAGSWPDVSRAVTVVAFSDLNPLPATIDLLALAHRLAMASGESREVTGAAWRFLGRSGGEHEAKAILGAVMEGNESALAGLANVRSESFLWELKSLIETPVLSAFQQRVLKAAATELFAIGSRSSLLVAQDYLARKPVAPPGPGRSVSPGHSRGAPRGAKPGDRGRLPEHAIRVSLRRRSLVSNDTSTT